MVGVECSCRLVARSLVSLEATLSFLCSSYSKSCGWSSNDSKLPDEHIVARGTTNLGAPPGLHDFGNYLQQVTKSRASSMKDAASSYLSSLQMTAFQEVEKSREDGNCRSGSQGRKKRRKSAGRRRCEASRLPSAAESSKKKNSGTTATTSSAELGSSVVVALPHEAVVVAHKPDSIASGAEISQPLPASAETLNFSHPPANKDKKEVAESVRSCVARLTAYLERLEASENAPAMSEVAVVEERS